MVAKWKNPGRGSKYHVLPPGKFAGVIWPPEPPYGSRATDVHRRSLNLSPSKHRRRRRYWPPTYDVISTDEVSGPAAGWDRMGGRTRWRRRKTGAGNFTADWFSDWLIDWLTGWPFWCSGIDRTNVLSLTTTRRGWPVDRQQQLLIFCVELPLPRRCSSQMAVVSARSYAGSQSEFSGLLDCGVQWNRRERARGDDVAVYIWDRWGPPPGCGETTDRCVRPSVYPALSPHWSDWIIQNLTRRGAF